MDAFLEKRVYDSGLIVWSRSYENLRFLPHYHRETELIYIRSGSAHINVAGVNLLCREGDLVICRGGASTISEVTALGMPAIIVPSPYVVNNHQEKNASVLEHAGGIRMILEADSTGEKLYNTAMEILSSDELREKMHKALLSLAVPDATEQIYRTVMGILDEKA